MKTERHTGKGAEMVYTLTLNPALDLVIDIGKINPGCLNRLTGERYFIGGKGINVSCVLSELGMTSSALGFCAGFTGTAIAEGLKTHGVTDELIRLESGFSRINVKIRSDNETELNADGPFIGSSDIDKLFEKLDMIKDDDILVLGGSVPKCLPDDIYERITERVSDKDIRVIADTSGKKLMDLLKYRPFLIKPNIHELSELFGISMSGADEVAEYAVKLRGSGARNVLVSMGSDGAVLASEDGEIYRCGACRGRTLYTVGAGDSMVAGFIAGILGNGGYEYALKLGTACGGATAFSEGLASKKLIYKLLEQLG